MAESIYVNWVEIGLVVLEGRIQQLYGTRTNTLVCRTFFVFLATDI